MLKRAADSPSPARGKRAREGSLEPDRPESPIPERKQLANRDYTVGWICALPVEYVAAQEFLDEEHDDPEEISPQDNNDYTLGRIGKHNVVIAVLPKGQYGLVNAATVATDLLQSFPSIRFGLMVGIGGGAPSPANDIRLGDIVVSSSKDENGAVCQFDLGKRIQNQEFQITSFLSQPPQILQTATSGLQAQYRRKGHQIHKTICNILRKNPRLWEEYKRPDEATDILYSSDFIHENSKGTCCPATSCSMNAIMQRSVRAKHEDNPAVHYGLVGSANELMRDASTRDKLSKEKGILCFEMEAAGLMNRFPCLVIRGICDYSDTHKNKIWQGYASMTAAAYAKDLLYRVQPSKVEAEQKLGKLIIDGQYQLLNYLTKNILK
jgi:nucleoside phosphorylase